MSEQLANMEKLGSIDYSTDEQWTGKRWIDGKPIYQKTINFGALPNASSKNVAHNVANLKLIFLEGTAYRSTDGANIPIPFIATDSMSGNVRVNVTSTNVSIWTGDDRSLWTGYVTIFYTKTTD